MDTAEWKLKFAQDHQFLREVVYVDLPDLNTGFDSPDIGHFSPEDFLVIIDRCESLGVRLVGVEVFSTVVGPPWKLAMLEVETSPEEGFEWARRLARRYKGKSDITLCATFDVPADCHRPI